MDIISTGLPDSHGTVMKVGDRVRSARTCNPEIHGSWVEYEIVSRGIVPILVYVVSEKGQVLPPRSTAGLLSDEYDLKEFLFGIDILSLYPTELLEVVEY